MTGENRNLFTFFSSAARRIPFFWINACAAIAFSIGLGFIAFRFFQQQTDILDFHEKEKIGIALATELTRSTIVFSAGSHAEPTELAAALESVRKVRQNLFREKSLGAFTDEEKKSWAESLSILDRAGIPNTEADFTALLIAVKKLKALVLDKSYLILDPKLQEYHLIVSLFSHLPEMFFYDRTTLELRMLSLSRGERSALHQELGIRKAALSHFMDSASKGLLEANPSKKNILQEKNRAMESEMEKLWRLLENPTAPAPSGEIVICRPARRAALEVLSVGVSHLTELNESRIQNASNTMGTALILSVVFWILSVILILASLGSYLKIRADMLGVISVQKRALDAAQKLATLGELSGSIGHDIGNPLMVIESVTSVIERMYQEKHPEILNHTNQLHRMVDRIEAIIRSLKNLMSNKRQEVVVERVRMKNVFDDVELLVQHRARIHGVTLIFDLPDQSFDVMGNESDFIQVFVNLICNAIDAVKASEVREVRVTLQESDELLRIFVADNGPGVPADLRSKIFEPLFTTKPKGEGTGLGLAICQKMVLSHGGQIEILPTQTGACFQVTFKKAPRTS